MSTSLHYLFERVASLTPLPQSSILIVASLCLRDYYLPDTQSRPEAEEEYAHRDDESVIDGKKEPVSP
jgi:hypothetical protein